MNCGNNGSGASVFSPKDPNERVVLTFDFTAGLAVGELLSSAAPVVTIEVVAGEDLNPADLVAASPAVNTVPLPQTNGVPIATSKAVQFLVKGGVLSASYNITALATTTSSPAQVLACRGQLDIRKA